MLGVGVSLRSLRGTTAIDPYKIAGFKPPLVLDFIEDYYRTGGSASTFDDALNFSRASAATYTDADGVLQTAAAGAPRVGNHVYNGSEWVNEGLLFESEARTQLLHTTDALVTQSKTVTAVPHTLHFTGTGTVTLSGASTSGPLVGTGTGEENRVSLTFTPTAASLTLTVSGTVSDAQLEVGSTPSSYIPNLAASGEVTRAAETLDVAAADMPWSSSAISIAMEGTMTYADDDSLSFNHFLNWSLDAQNEIGLYLDTRSTDTGQIGFYQRESNLFSATVSASDTYSPGVNVPFSIASRHGATFVNGAVDGTAVAVSTNPIALPDLSSTDMDIAPNFMGTIKSLRIWAEDLGDEGIGEASA